MFKTFIRKRKAAQAKKDFERGYDYAASSILRANPKYVEGEIAALYLNIDAAVDFGVYNDFDKGIRRACSDAGMLIVTLRAQTNG